MKGTNAAGPGRRAGAGAAADAGVRPEVQAAPPAARRGGGTVSAAGDVAADLASWDAWRPEEVAEQLAGVDAPWCVAAGWAIDLFLGGGRRREHEDLEIAVPCERFDEVARALAAYDLYVPTGEHTLRPLAAAGDLDSHQTWVRDRRGAAWKLDVFREPSEGETWICRRDERIRLPYADVVERTADGIPFARPEIVLLFKAKQARPKDEQDLAAVLPRLGRERRRLLAGWLGLVHPGHAWIARLGPASSASCPG